MAIAVERAAKAADERNVRRGTASGTADIRVGESRVTALWRRGGAERGFRGAKAGDAIVDSGEVRWIAMERGGDIYAEMKRDWEKARG